MKTHFVLSSRFRRLGIWAGAGFIALIIGVCSLAPKESFAFEKGATDMLHKTDCTKNAVARSRCIIEAILSDIGETYKPIGGGGISMIKQDATWVFTVSISQEEKTDLITYTVEMSPEGDVIIKDRKTGTKSHGR